MFVTVAVSRESGMVYVKYEGMPWKDTNGFPAQYMDQAIKDNLGDFVMLSVYAGPEVTEGG